MKKNYSQPSLQTVSFETCNILLVSTFGKDEDASQQFNPNWLEN